MNYSAIYYNDTINGNGFRTSLFVSGCSKYPKCKECYNSEAWSFKYGNIFTEQTKQDILNSLKPHYIKGLSILGGEPADNLSDGTLIDLVKSIKQIYPNKTIYVWSGYKFEDLINKRDCLELFKYVDMLRDGEYIPELKNINQYLQGSSNQRIIDIKESLKANKVIEYKINK